MAGQGPSFCPWILCAPHRVSTPQTPARVDRRVAAPPLRCHLYPLRWTCQETGGRGLGGWDWSRPGHSLDNHCPMHLPLATCTALGPGALAYHRALGQTPQNRAPLTAGHQGGEEETDTGGEGSCGNPVILFQVRRTQGGVGVGRGGGVVLLCSLVSVMAGRGPPTSWGRGVLPRAPAPPPRQG